MWCACAHIRVSVQVCGRERSRQVNREVYWVPLRSGSLWSVSCNDTWQQLGGFALAVLYIRVTTDKSQHPLNRRNLHPSATGSSMQDKREEDGNTSFLLYIPVPPMLTGQRSCDSSDGPWLIGSGSANFVSSTGGRKAAWQQTNWAWEMKPGCCFFSCTTAKGKKEVCETFPAHFKSHIF